MSGQEKKHRSHRGSPKSSAPAASISTTNTSASSIIAQPPRAALHRRSKPDHESRTEEKTSSKPSLENSMTTTDTEDPHATPSSSSSCSSAAAKDGRISDLERELTTMADEFEKELTQLSHKLTNASETSSFWSAKYSSLNTTYLKADTDLRLIRSELASIHTSHEMDMREVNTRISSLILDRDGFREAYNDAMDEVKRREQEVRDLRGQVRGLKSWVSSSSKTDEQVGDETFGEAGRRLGNGLQNWVITHFRKARIDTTRAPENIKDELLSLIPDYEFLASSSKIHLIQSLVSQLLVTQIFSAFFFGLSPEQESQLKNIETCLGSAGTVQALNQWRSTTLSILHKSPRSLIAQTESMTSSLVTQINTLLYSISDITPSKNRDSALHTIITSSIDLSRLLRVQKATFTVVMPRIEDHQRTMFDPETMDDIGGEDEDTLSEREIRCITFPGIVKNGDENGEKSHLRNVVLKTRVLCAPD